MNIRNAILAMTAGLVVIGLGVLAHLDTAFQDAATDVGVILLGLLALCGLLGVLIAPLLDAWITDGDHDPVDDAQLVSAGHAEGGLR